MVVFCGVQSSRVPAPGLTPDTPSPKPSLCYGRFMLRRWPVLWVFVFPLLLSCSPRDGQETASRQEVLEVEDESLPVDAALSPETDVKGPPIVQGVSGVLPSDYPRGLPTPEPSSVSDVGDGPNGMRFVELESPTGSSTVVTDLQSRLKSSGWSVSRIADGRFEASKQGAEVRFEISPLYSGSRIRVEYR